MPYPMRGFDCHTPHFTLHLIQLLPFVWRFPDKTGRGRCRHTLKHFEMVQPILTLELYDLRCAAGISQQDAASYFELKDRNSVGAWERGESHPHKKRRERFITYLLDKLHLRKQPDTFFRLWAEIMRAQWNWLPLNEAELCHRFTRQELQYYALKYDVHLSSLDQAVETGRRGDGAEIDVVSAWARFQEMPTNLIPPNSPLPPCSYIPLRSNPYFVGRADVLQTVSRALKKPPAIAIGQTVVITGIGGMGKTQLAVEFVHRYGCYFQGGVFWINFADADTVPTQVAICGDAEHLALSPNFHKLDLENQIKLVKKAWFQAIPRLLIFDNCESEALLEKWRPRSGCCYIIITSRRGKWSPTSGVTQIPLRVLSRAESVQLLQWFRADLREDEANAIAATVGDLPLALYMAGSYLHTYQHDITPAAYLTELSSGRDQDILAHPSFQSVSSFSSTQHSLTVAHALAISYEKLDSQSERDALARQLLIRAAQFAPGEPIPREFLAASVTAPTLAISDALRRLANVGLVTEKVDGGIRLHQLVVEFAKSRIIDQAAQTGVERGILTILKRINEREDQTPLRAWESHVRYVTNIARSREDGLAATLCREFGEYLRLRWKYIGAREYLEDALDKCERIFGTDHVETAQTMKALGLLVGVWGEHEKAQRYLEMAVKIHENALGRAHPFTAEALNDLGFVLMRMGNLEIARLPLEQALAIREAVLGVDHPLTAHTLHQIGLWHSVVGNYREAQTCWEKVLHIRQKAMGVDHPLTADDLNAVGHILIQRGRYDEARPYYEKALAIRERVFGPEHPLTAHSLNNLGRLFCDLAEYEQARRYLTRALSIGEAVIAVDSSLMGSLMGALFRSMGVLLFETGEYAKAVLQLRQSLLFFENTVGADHHLVATSFCYLGRTQQKMGQGAEARASFINSLQIRRRKLGKGHPDTARALHYLGVLLHEEGNVDGAVEHLESALTVLRQKLDAHHPFIADTLFHLALLYREIGNEEAEAYLERAHSIYESALGGKHPKTVAAKMMR